MAKYVKEFEIQGEVLKIKDEEAREAILHPEKSYIIIGDSYGVGVTPSGNVKSWIEYVKESVRGSFTTSAIGGSGFCNGYTFLQQLVDVTSRVDTNSITDIVIGGGFNDLYYGVDAIESAITSFATYVKEHYPKANVIILQLGWSQNWNFRTAINNAVIVGYSKSCGKNGMSFFPNCCYCLHDYTFMSSDNIHPNARGYEALGNAVASYLNGGTYTYESGFLFMNITNADAAVDNFIGYSIRNDVAQITFGESISIWNKDIQCGTWYALANIPDTSGILGTNKETPFTSIHTSATVKLSDDTYVSCPTTICFDSEEKKVWIKFLALNDAKTGWLTMLGVQDVQMPSFSAMFASYLC